MPTRDHRTKPGDSRKIEYRSIPSGGEMSRRADGDAPGFTGYASKPWVVDSYGTALHPDAFNETLKGRARDNGAHIPHLLQHWPENLIGRHRELRFDGTGLFVDVELFDDGAEGSVTIKRLRGGAPFGMSFGFQTIRERPATSGDPIIFGDGTPEWVRANPTDAVWVIEEVKLYETSTVTFPSNETATIEAVRSQSEALALSQTLDDLRAGRRLDDTVTALITDLAAALALRPDLTRQAPPNRFQAPLSSTFDFDLALAELASHHGIYLTHPLEDA